MFVYIDAHYQILMAESLYESIVEESNDGILVAQEGEIVYVNDRLLTLTGYDESDLLGQSKTTLVTDEDSDIIEEYHEARMAGDSAPNQYEVDIETADGDQIPVELSVSRGEYDGSPAAISFCRDISTQRARERELERLRWEHEAIFENIQDALFLLDIEDEETVTYQRFNRREEEVTGKPSAEVRGQTPVETFGEELGSELQANYEECIERAATVVYEETIEFGDEPTVWQTKLTPIVVDGQVEKIVGSGREITERREYEQKLERARKRLQVLFEQAPDGVVVHDADGAVLDVNSRIVESLGYPRDELLSMTVTDFEVSVDEDQAREFWAEMDVGGTLKFEGEHERKDGSTVPVEVWVSKIVISGEKRYLALSRDITDRKESERELAAERDFLDSVIESLPYPFYVIDVDDYTIEYANSRATVTEGETYYERTYEPDEPCDEGEIAFPLSDVAERGEPVTLEHIRRDDDGTERIFQVHASPIFDEDGTVVQMAESNIDITDRVESQRRLEQQRDNLELLNKIVRHDIRNDLQVVSTYAETLENYVEADGETYLSKILDASRDAVEITETARDVTEIMIQSDTEPSPVGLRRVLEGEIEDVRANYDQALVTVDGSIPGVTVLADDMLESVFRNLLSNGIQHNDKEVPEVIVRATRADDAVTIEIADNGPGIPDDRKEDIFEEGEYGLDSSGTGLGLYLVDTLVDRYGGEIYVEDNDPDGSVFVLTLPVAE